MPVPATAAATALSVDDDHGGGAATNPIRRECAHRDVDGNLVTDVVHQSFDHRNEDGVHAAPR